MCNCNVEKECCGCLMGGCDCICDCVCHTGDENDPCWAFPSLDCEECEAKIDAELAAESTKVPTDHEIALALIGKRDILDIG